MKKTLTNTRDMKKNIINYMDDLYRDAQTEGKNYPSVESGLNVGVRLSSNTAMTKNGEKDVKNKICVWNPRLLQSEGDPHLVILLVPYGSGFLLEIKRVPHENTNHHLKKFIDTIVSMAMRNFELYGRIEEEK